MDYIIVQAGGLGSRMKSYTRNKPKALVPVNNLPIIFHLFSKYPDKKFIVIGDYKKDVLQKYLHTFAPVQHIVVGTEGKKGTCSGIVNALKYVPEKEPFMLIWSDLILPMSFEMPEEVRNYIGISKDFPCRWSYKKNEFVQEASSEFGVAGFFTFVNKVVLQNVPKEGEFVVWLKEQNIEFSVIPLYKTREYGLYETVERPEGGRCRAFNQIRIEGNRLIKEGIDNQGLQLAKKEAAWYEKAKEYQVEQIPKIYQTNPLVIEMIQGKNVFLYDYTKQQKEEVLKNIIESLKNIHSKKQVSVDYFSIRKAYYNKTMERLEKVRSLVPFTEELIIHINGKDCRNIFFHQSELEEKIANLKCKEFCFIHGDCTFSNIVMDEQLRPYFIDPRGYFGNTQFYGDPLYDWAKLYYSIVGNYDQFNLKQFDLSIAEDKKIILSIRSNGWEELEECFFRLLGNAVQRKEIKLIHAIIWLSLTTYAWEDYDSICAAFYNGLYYLEECL